MGASTVIRNRTILGSTFSGLVSRWSWIGHTIRIASGVGIGLFLVSISGCASDSTGPAAQDISQVFWSLRLNHEAIQMAVHDTIQLNAIPLNANGDTLQRSGNITYTLPDSTDSTVTVSAIGQLVAHYVTVGTRTAKVVASLRDPVQGITNQDTAVIVVTATTDSLTQFSLQPALGDSAKRALGDANGIYSGVYQWPVRATDIHNVTLCRVGSCQLSVSYHSSNPLVASIDGRTGKLTARDTGRVMLKATTFAYGVEYRDTVAFTIGPSLAYVAFVGGISTNPAILTPLPDTLVLGVGGRIEFLNSFSLYKGLYEPYQITFDLPQNVDSAADLSFGTYSGAGDLSFNCDSLISRDCYMINYNTFQVTYNEFDKARQFPVAGTYIMRISLFPSKKTVIEIK